MDDLISRAAAIERATKDHDFYKGATIPTDKARRDELLNVMCWLGELPSAQPERKRGKWVFYEDRAPVWDIAGEKTWARAYKCPECGFVHSVIEDFGQYAFCPNCGADMREVDDERHD